MSDAVVHVIIVGGGLPSLAGAVKLVASGRWELVFQARDQAFETVYFFSPAL